VGLLSFNNLHLSIIACAFSALTLLVWWQEGQITTPAPYQSFFTGWMPFLPPNQWQEGHPACKK